MSRPKKYIILLTDEEFRKLGSIVRKKNTTKTMRHRCQILMDLDEAHGRMYTHQQSADNNGVCMATVTNVVRRYAHGGVCAAIYRKNI